MEDTKKHDGTFIEIDKRLYKEIKSYTTLNKLSPTRFINDLLQKAFMIEKYGDAPACLAPKAEPAFKKTPCPDIIEQEEKIEQKPQPEPAINIEPDEVKQPQIKGKKIITY